MKSSKEGVAPVAVIGGPRVEDRVGLVDLSLEG
jgi:hypothetical protein